MKQSVLSKYLIDDLPNSITSKLEVQKAITILEYHPNTKLSYREKFAVALKNINFYALSDYLMQVIDYDEFFIRAQKEQENRPSYKTKSISQVEQETFCSNIEQNNNSILTHKLELLKQKKSKKTKDTLIYVQNMKDRHIQETYDLKVKHALELNELNKKNKRELQVIQKEIDEVEHQIKLESDKEYAEKYYAEQKRIQEEKEKKELEQKFLKSFGISFVDTKHREVLFLILKKLSNKERLLAEETIWLTTIGKDYFYKESEVYKTYHKIEAEYYVKIFHETQDIWNVVNACSHFRKAKLANKAEILFKDILNKKIPNKRLKSAFFTTFGGVMRDLFKFQDGIELAKQAHNLSSRDYRPCTLLGALYFEINEYEEGQTWFYLAEELGAPQKNADAEIKAIYNKSDTIGKEKLKAYLLNQDPIRYAWLKRNSQ